MEINIYDTPKELGKHASKKAAQLINQAIESQGFANVILATGASQFEVLNNLVTEEIPWEKVTMFHLDEYIGMSDKHPASFKKYLTERFLEKIDFACTYYLIDGEADSAQEIKRVSDLIAKHPIDVALIGVGENGHLAFNDPPADFDTEAPYIEVELDHACRQQQFGEGWFDTFESVPTKAISMSIKQILKSKSLIVSVPDARKADAIFHTVNSELSNACPGTALRSHEDCMLFLDKASASKL